jgi:hypothetical protein
VAYHVGNVCCRRFLSCAHPRCAGLLLGDSSSQTGLGKCPTNNYWQALHPFSPERVRAVRFRRLHHANAMRSQRDDEAKAPSLKLLHRLMIATMSVATITVNVAEREGFESAAKRKRKNLRARLANEG